jgi:hypothetical protein
VFPDAGKHDVMQRTFLKKQMPSISSTQKYFSKEKMKNEFKSFEHKNCFKPRI